MSIRTQNEWKDSNGILDSFVQGHAYSSHQITKSNPLFSYLDEYLTDLKKGKESLNESFLEKYRIAISDFIEIVGAINGSKKVV